MVTDRGIESRQNFDAMQKLIIQHRHVTSCEIALTSGISFTCMYNILKHHLAAKKLCCFRCKQMLKKCTEDALKEVYNIATGDELWNIAYEPKTAR